MDLDSKETKRLVLVTGPSGAGRATAINVLEDLGYEAIDNIPLSLIPRLVDGSDLTRRPLALGLDVRNRDFSGEGLLELHAALAERPGWVPDLLYLDCDEAVLSQRYSETRRRHPLAPDETPVAGIAREKVLLEDVRARADILIDTTALTVHELRSALETWFATDTGERLALSLHSFSYKRGLPQGLDMVFDVRFLRNPHWEPSLRSATGLETRVARYIAEDDRYEPFLTRVLDLIRFLLPEAVKEGKAHLSIGFGCTGGQHRSVALTEAVADTLAKDGWTTSMRHRELERRGVPGLDAGRMKRTGA
ncbi:RNase adapter RapZ [Cognatishimia sp. F0-27]|uniref:RNase adapter RapZ n=1 Tax=Cognatishimia sp. F0-27 TaxID=2816855 RepID=UPI001D0C4062|nr:RNase adapter RapZ [Cognatishimia sp. F0-27]MCC1491118.1 RNase adapter RapZ [Cognatishimia sp. F0-27]